MEHCWSVTSIHSSSCPPVCLLVYLQLSSQDETGKVNATPEVMPLTLGSEQLIEEPAVNTWCNQEVLVLNVTGELQTNPSNTSLCLCSWTLQWVPKACSLLVSSSYDALTCMMKDLDLKRMAVNRLNWPLLCSVTRVTVWMAKLYDELLHIRIELSCTLTVKDMSGFYKHK